MTRRNSDEVSLDIVMALLVGIPAGVAVALLVGGIGWLAGRDFSGLAGWFGMVGAVLVVGVTLSRSERTLRRASESADASP